MRAPITATMVLGNRGWCNAVTALVLVTVTPNANDVGGDNVLHAFGSLEAVEKFLFVDVNGNISENFISLFRAQPAEITSVTPNRTETRTYGISPYLIGQAGSAFSYELRNQNIWTNATSEALADTQLMQCTGPIASPTGILASPFPYPITRITE